MVGIKLNLFVKLHPHAHRLQKRRGRRLRPVRPSRANELWYKAELLRIVKLLRKSAERHLLPVLRLLTSANGAVGDATPPSAESQFNSMKMEFGGVEGVAQRLAREAVLRNLQAVDERLKAAIKDAVKVDVQAIFANDHELREAMAEATKANVALITSIPEQYFEKLEKAVSDNFVQGVRYEHLQSVVQHIADITESRAKLIARDQTSKMNSAFNSIRQQQVGIQKYQWQTMEDERVRESHAEMDGQECRWDSPPEVDGEPANPGEPIECFPGDSELQFADGIRKAYRRWFDGELTSIVTDSGKTLRATPNHPVFTPQGLVRIGALNEGDYIIEVAPQAFEVPEHNQHQRVPVMVEVFEACAKRGITQPRRLSKTEFHGDGADGQVDIVFAAGPLRVDFVTEHNEGAKQFPFSEADDSSAGIGATDQISHRLRFAANCIVSRVGKFLSLAGGQLAHAQKVCVRAIAKLNACLTQTVSNNDAAIASALGNRQYAFPIGVGVDQGLNIDRQEIRRLASDLAVGSDAGGSELLAEVVGIDLKELGDFFESLPFSKQAVRVRSVNRLSFSGHVYNLETKDGYYVTNGILIHNCRCLAVPVFDLDEE